MKRLPLLAIAAPLLLTAASSGNVVTGSFQGADPDITVFTVPGVNGGNPLYYIYNTSTEVWTSPDKKTWTDRGQMLDFKNDPDDVPWIVNDRDKRGVWAPDMEKGDDGNYYMYFAIGPNTAYGGSRIGVQVCSSPLPPCQKVTDGSGASSYPLAIRSRQGFEAIDPAYFQDPKDGQRYIYAGGSAGSTLRVFRLNADMKTIDGEVTVDQPYNFTEAPFMHSRMVDGQRVYYLSYSFGNYQNSSYKVRYVTSDSPTGPWSASKILVQSNDTYKGPGHNAFVLDPASGNWLFAYHRYENKTGDGPYVATTRRTAVETVTYTGKDIDPIVMTP